MIKSSTTSIKDDDQNLRLAKYLHSIDNDLVVHNSTETGTPWHIAPHTEGAPYLQCSTSKAVGKQLYVTVVSELREGTGAAELLKIETVVLPKATWIKAYGEAAGMPVLNQPASLQVLASRASGKAIPTGY